MMTNNDIPIVITGISLISALGNLATTWSKILAGNSGIKMHQVFPELPALPLGLINEKPAQFNDLLDQLIIDLLADANLTLPLPNFGISIGSSRSFQPQLEQLAFHPNYPLSIINLLPHQGAISCAEKIGTGGPILAPMAACNTGIWAIIQGYELIQNGLCQGVIAGAIEAPISPLTIAGFQQMGAFAKTGVYPFDRNREGMALGEGGALFVLEPLPLAQQRQAQIYGRILGFSCTNDATYINAPVVGGKSSIACLQQCLERSQLTPHQIDLIIPHGTGTELNDRHEAILIEKILTCQIPISSNKGAIGHTLGSSAALSIALALLSMRSNLLPPNIGLKISEFPLNFTKKTTAAEINHTLCLSFGFGGQNGAIVLGKIDRH